MKWSEIQVSNLKELCYQGKSNKDIAKILNCNITDVYAKRSQLGVTIDKCKGVKPSPEFEKALAQEKPRSMCKEVKKAFEALSDALLLTIVSDRTSREDARLYTQLSNNIADLEDLYNTKIGEC